MDPYAVGSLEIPMHRSIFNTSTSNETVPREFPNSITGWMDGSMVYGSSLKDSNWLRTFSRGQLKVTETEQGEFLPLAGGLAIPFLGGQKTDKQPLNLFPDNTGINFEASPSLKDKIIKKCPKVPIEANKINNSNCLISKFVQ